MSEREPPPNAMACACSRASMLIAIRVVGSPGSALRRGRRPAAGRSRPGAQLFRGEIGPRDADGHWFPQSKSTASQNHNSKSLGTRLSIVSDQRPDSESCHGKMKPFYLKMAFHQKARETQTERPLDTVVVDRCTIDSVLPCGKGKHFEYP